MANYGKYLVDSVQSSKFITREKARDITAKLKTFAGKDTVVKACIRGWLTYFGIASMKTTIANERLVQAGCYSILGRYESLHLCYPTAGYRTLCSVVWEVG